MRMVTRIVVKRDSDGNDEARKFQFGEFEELQEAIEELGSYNILNILNREREKRAKEMMRYDIKQSLKAVNCL